MNVERLSFKAGGRADMICSAKTSAAIGIAPPVLNSGRSGRLAVLTRVVQRKLAGVVNINDVPKEPLPAPIDHKLSLQKAAPQPKPVDKRKGPAPAQTSHIPATDGKRFPDVDEIIDEIDDLSNVFADSK